MLAYVSQYLGKLTRSAAEYQALIAALVEGKRLNLEGLVVYTESLFLREQINGILKRRAKHLEPLLLMAKQLMQGFQSVDLVAIDRNQNGEAERLALGAIQSAKSARKPVPK
jgi:ribonuclease HI